MNRKILHIALPAIIANITIPLLGLIDIGIAGHLGCTEFIGAIAVGAMMFNLIYWNFGFLRMGTSGLTAQAYGSNNNMEQQLILVRSVSLAFLIAVAIIALQFPLQWLALTLIAPSPDVYHLAQNYFYICVWAAPAILIMMAIKGWFLGMQDSRRPMYISIGVNVVNIIASLVAVFVLRLGFIGIAFGSLIAAYCGLAFGLFLLYRHHADLLKHIQWTTALHLADLKKFFRINSDIFLRSLCMMLVTLFFMAQGARSGDIILAVNALMMQLFVLFSYFMDGFAFAGEALVGRFSGAKEHDKLSRCIRFLFLWGLIVTILFTLTYAFSLRPIFSLLTDDTVVIETALNFHWWCVAIPAAGMAAFVWDGVFIGLTATRQMLLSLFIASLTFFGIYYLIPGASDNNRLWLAFIVYLAMRGIVLSWLYVSKISH